VTRPLPTDISLGGGVSDGLAARVGLAVGDGLRGVWVSIGVWVDVGAEEAWSTAGRVAVAGGWQALSAKTSRTSIGRPFFIVLRGFRASQKTFISLPINKDVSVSNRKSDGLRFLSPEIETLFTCTPQKQYDQAQDKSAKKD